MEMYSIGIAAVVVALLFTLLFVLSGSRGPWDSAWTLFLVLFLALWATGLFINPLGPVYWGIAWVPLISVGLLLAILFMAVTPSRRRRRLKDSKIVEVKNPEDADTALAGITLGLFFWLLILLFLVAIIIGSIVRVY